MKLKEVNYLAPFIALVILFFFIGFLTTANGQFQGQLMTVFLSESGNLKYTFATLISFSWFMAYPITGSIGSKWSAKYGYKSTLVRALLIMIVGLGIFWLSSFYTVRFPESYVKVSSAVIPWGYFIFLLGSFVVGSAATILQVVINPYLSACNVPNTQAIQRLNIGGASNSVGTTVAPLFVTGIVFGGLTVTEVQVDQLQTPFIWLIGVIALVAIVVSHLSLPEIEGTKASKFDNLDRSIWSFKHLTLGIIAIFFYVGIEVCIGANINLYALELEKNGSLLLFFGLDSLKLFGVNFSIPTLMASLYWAGMLLGRLVSSSLKNVSANFQLAFCAIMAALCTILAIILNNPWFLVAVGLFHSVMWGAIFTLSVNKLGKYTSLASGVFMIGVIGGALLPLFQGILADAMQGSWRWTWFIVVLSQLYIFYYALFGSKVNKIEC